MTTRTGWCLPRWGSDDCYDHEGCRLPDTCGCPQHETDNDGRH